jgi:hypothetical protein
MVMERLRRAHRLGHAVAGWVLCWFVVMTAAPLASMPRGPSEAMSPPVSAGSLSASDHHVSADDASEGVDSKLPCSGPRHLQAAHEELASLAAGAHAQADDAPSAPECVEAPSTRDRPAAHHEATPSAGTQQVSTHGPAHIDCPVCLHAAACAPVVVALLRLADVVTLRLEAVPPTVAHSLADSKLPPARGPPSRA